MTALVADASPDDDQKPLEMSLNVYEDGRALRCEDALGQTLSQKCEEPCGPRTRVCGLQIGGDEFSYFHNGIRVFEPELFDWRVRNSRHFSARFGQALLGTHSPKWLDRMADDGALVGPAAGRSAADDGAARDPGCFGGAAATSAFYAPAYDAARPAPDLEEWARGLGGEPPDDGDDDSPNLEADAAAARAVVAGRAARRRQRGGVEVDVIPAVEEKEALAEHLVAGQLSSFLDRSLDGSVEGSAGGS
ncbi:hypothetical protein JL722_7391 [Aureococcus anophagefferens]|nr:hypothetical protein JL722_7391 [Aureococcus anophagefferens]